MYSDEQKIIGSEYDHVDDYYYNDETALDKAAKHQSKYNAYILRQLDALHTGMDDLAGQIENLEGRLPALESDTFDWTDLNTLRDSLESFKATVNQVLNDATCQMVASQKNAEENFIGIADAMEKKVEELEKKLEKKLRAERFDDMEKRMLEMEQQVKMLVDLNKALRRDLTDTVDENRELRTVAAKYGGKLALLEMDELDARLSSEAESDSSAETGCADPSSP